MTPDSAKQSLSVLHATSGLLPPVRQVQTVVQDAAGFVNRGLAILWREVVAGDVAGFFAAACSCITNDDRVALARLLQDCPELLEHRSPEAEGYQLLHHAAANGAIQCISLLLEQGACVDAMSGHLQVVDEGFRPGATALLVATQQGRAESVGALLAGGANVNARLPATQETSLHFAAARGDAVALELLINSGAALEAWSNRAALADVQALVHPETPLHAAARNNHAEILRILLKAGADRDAARDGYTALHCAAGHARVAALEVLLAAGADPDVADAGGCTPLDYAQAGTHADAVDMLCRYGARAAEEIFVAQTHPEGVSAHAQPAIYAEQRDFLFGLLAEHPPGSRSLLVLSDWLAEMLGAEHRPLLARAFRERQREQECRGV